MMLDKYIKSQELGYIRKDRIQFARERELMYFDEERKDYYLTKKAMMTYKNFYSWISGNSDSLIRYEESEKDSSKEIFNGVE